MSQAYCARVFAEGFSPAKNQMTVRDYVFIILKGYFHSDSVLSTVGEFDRLV